jgi:hypothetical protein
MMRQWLYRVFMSVLVTCYLAVGYASHNRDNDTWSAVYKKLRFMQAGLCFWQNWGMFAPPPGSTSWMLIEGTTEDGTVIHIEPLFDAVEPGFFRWRYDRRQKLTLSSFRDSRKALRDGIGRNACWRAEQAGTPVVTIKLIRDRTWALKPGKRWKDPDAEKRHKVTEVGTFKCD